MRKITLFAWQREALTKWIENKGQGIVESPTGAGKTYLGLKLIEKEKLSPFLIIVPTVELKNQWIERIRKYYPDATVIGVGGGEKYKEFTNTLNFSNRKIMVAIINSIRKHQFMCKTLILDEIHHYSSLAPVNFKIWDNITYKFVLGLSASPIPERLGEADVGWDIPTVYKYSLRQAYDDRILLKPEIITKSVQLEDREQREYDELTEQIKAKAGTFSSFSNAPVWFKSWVFDRNEILFGSQMKLLKLREIITENSFKKCIIFAERIDSLHDITRELSNLNVECLSIHSKMKKKERREVVNRFINASYPVILLNAHIFEEGVSIPQVDLLILYSFNNTRRESLQRIGRALHNTKTTPKIYILYYKDTKENYVMKKIRRMFE